MVFLINLSCKTVVAFLTLASTILTPALASFANVYGVCNFYNQTISFHNGENSGNDCDAEPCNTISGMNCGCNAKRAWIPKCENEGDFNNHHAMWVDVPGKNKYLFIKCFFVDSSTNISPFCVY